MKSYSARIQTHDRLLEHLLFHRDIKTPEEIEQFLNPSYDRHTHDPFLLKDMDKVVDRILLAIKNEEKTVIYSDYDTDGIPGAVVLHDFFNKAGLKNFTNYIPHRHDEGFGVNSDAVEKFIADDVKLLITIDCGITDVKPVGEAAAKGIDVIITDHHLPGVEIPKAYAIVNPKQVDCEYPEKMLCGSGVIFKLVQALIKKANKDEFFAGKIKEGWEKWLLDMVGIATLSDMVPLRGENRVFAYFGLTVLRRSPRLGLMQLLRELAVDQRYLTEDDIGFTIGPRINAASRMGVPMDAFKLLSTSDPLLAGQYAKHLNNINNERKGTVAALVKEAKKNLKERWGEDGKDMPRVIVMGNPEWRPALVGLAANTLAEEYRRPAYIWGRDGDNIIKGSCRSDGETDLVALMQAVEAASPGTFIQSGGHAFAGGFSVSNEKIHDLPEKLNAAFAKVLEKRNATAKAAGSAGALGVPNADDILVDKELSLGDVTWKTYETIEKLAPFGTGNPKPLFMFKNVMPENVRHFGKEKNHLEIVFKNRPSVKAIAFFKNSSDWVPTFGKEIRAGDTFTLIASFEKSIFRGKTELRLRIVDVVS